MEFKSKSSILDFLTHLSIDSWYAMERPDKEWADLQWEARAYVREFPEECVRFYCPTHRDVAVLKVDENCASNTDKCVRGAFCDSNSTNVCECDTRKYTEDTATKTCSESPWCCLLSVARLPTNRSLKYCSSNTGHHATQQIFLSPLVTWTCLVGFDRGPLTSCVQVFCSYKRLETFICFS